MNPITAISIFRAASVTDVVLVLGEKTESIPILPLGGTHFAQLGMLFLASYVLAEIFGFLSRE